MLLERILRLASNAGDVILDPFCGSGTTLVAAALSNRYAIGIDASAEAVALTRQRLKHPAKSESPLLTQGRESYQQADEGALGLLYGVDYVAVQRNNGIDAILKSDLDGKPILVRIQRPTETTLAAANALVKAAQGKQYARLLLIVTVEGGYFDTLTALPAEVQLIFAPAKQITDLLTEALAPPAERLS